MYLLYFPWCAFFKNPFFFEWMQLSFNRDGAKVHKFSECMFGDMKVSLSIELIVINFCIINVKDLL